MSSKTYVAVLDFGSQTTKLIARRVRELGLFSKILSDATSSEELLRDPPVAIILSGGPQSVLNTTSIRVDERIFELGIPILGICYGMQLMMEYLGWSIERAQTREFGSRAITITNSSVLFKNIKGPLKVWMSHSDQVQGHSSFVQTVAKSISCEHAAIECSAKKLYGVQFHPEVSHSEFGNYILRNFLFEAAGATANFALGDFLREKITQIKKQVGQGHVIMGLSGGVDSSVAAALIQRAVPLQFHCFYIDHGLGRLNENEEVRAIASELALPLHLIDARDLFLSALKDVSDPELKRKIIGHTFIEVFEREAAKLRHVSFLGQGTLYPDVIESSSHGRGHSEAIKSHHNVGGLPAHMKLELVEPLRELFKDEVRKIGAILNLSERALKRQPFPGPGLAVRIPGFITAERLAKLKLADAIVREEIEYAQKNGTILSDLWQWFAILLPIKSVGVMGDARVYGETIVVRCVLSCDAMTADWAPLPPHVLATMSSRITNEVSGISRVLYDITQKPPGTIEWE